MAFYIDVLDTSTHDFYYNVEKVVQEGLNEVIKRVLKIDDLDLKNDRYDRGRFVSINPNTKDISFDYADQLAGITAAVNSKFAEEILERAKYYCPKDTGKLADSGKIQYNPDGTCRIYFDAYYAWYVHELAWKMHKFPTCDHFLTRAIYEVEKLHGIGWA